MNCVVVVVVGHQHCFHRYANWHFVCVYSTIFSFWCETDSSEAVLSMRPFTDKLLIYLLRYLLLTSVWSVIDSNDRCNESESSICRINRRGHTSKIELYSNAQSQCNVCALNFYLAHNSKQIQKKEEEKKIAERCQLISIVLSLMWIVNVHRVMYYSVVDRRFV